MTLKDLLESCLIKDNHILYISIRISGKSHHKTRGEWYRDDILAAAGRRIESMEFDGDKTWKVTLIYEEDEK